LAAWNVLIYKLTVISGEWRQHYSVHGEFREYLLRGKRKAGKEISHKLVALQAAHLPQRQAIAGSRIKDAFLSADEVDEMIFGEAHITPLTNA
jgi:hypothetical protein